jgi:hypothetical protein
VLGAARLQAFDRAEEGCCHLSLHTICTSSLTSATLALPCEFGWQLCAAVVRGKAASPPDAVVTVERGRGGLDNFLRFLLFSQTVSVCMLTITINESKENPETDEGKERNSGCDMGYTCDV